MNETAVLRTDQCNRSELSRMKYTPGHSEFALELVSSFSSSSRGTENRRSLPRSDEFFVILNSATRK